VRPGNECLAAAAPHRLLVIGPLYAVAFSRWGSYVGLPSASLFFPDALVAVGAFLLVWPSMTSDRRQLLRPTDTYSGWLIFLTLTYVTLWVSQAGSTAHSRVGE
jgi:hypothetical protein